MRTRLPCCRGRIHASAKKDKSQFLVAIVVIFYLRLSVEGRVAAEAHEFRGTPAAASDLELERSSNLGAVSLRAMARRFPSYNSCFYLIIVRFMSDRQ